VPEKAIEEAEEEAEAEVVTEEEEAAEEVAEVEVNQEEEEDQEVVPLQLKLENLSSFQCRKQAPWPYLRLKFDFRHEYN